MKNSNKVLLAIIICFLVCPIFVVAMVRANLVSSKKNFQQTNYVGKNITKNFNVGDFSELDFSGSGNVIIKVGEKPSISVSTDEGYLADIDVGVIGGRLNIDTAQRIRWEHDRRIDIAIVTNKPLKKIIVSGASHLDYRDINSTDLVLEVSGASHCNLAGKVNSLQIETSGASHVDAKNLIANDISLETSGAADIRVYAKNSLKIDSSGMSHIDYYGNPKSVVRDISGMVSINGK